MTTPIVERLRDVHHTDFATRLEAADTITDLLAALELVLPHTEAERLAELSQARIKQIHRMPVRFAIGKAEAAIAKAKGGEA